MPSIVLNITRICDTQFKDNYLKNENLFQNFFLDFWHLHQISNILKQKVMVIANVFPKLQTVKNFVRPLCKKRCFGTRFDTHHDKVSQILAKSPWDCFYHVFSSFWEKLIWKISPVLLGEILRMFLNRLTAEGKYPIDDWENLPLPIQMQLSGKRKTFSQFIVPFVDSASNFKQFEKKMIAIANVFPQLETVKIFLRPLSKKCPKYLQNLHQSTFTMCFNHSKGSWFRKSVA